MLQLIIDPIKEWWRRRARREPYAEILYRERLRAYMEISEAAADMVGLEGRSKLAAVIIRNNLVLSREAMRLSNAVLFSPPDAEKPSTEFLKRVLDLSAHLRKELRIEQIDKEELQKILRAPKPKET